MELIVNHPIAFLSCVLLVFSAIKLNSSAKVRTAIRRNEVALARSNRDYNLAQRGVWLDDNGYINLLDN